VKIAAIGECMLELSTSSSKLYNLGYGGDTLNTAIYLSRNGGAVDYVTALGDDPFSEAMISDWQQEGVGTKLVMQKQHTLPGLYMIQTNAEGERSFHYWRQNAPAKTLFEDWPELFEQLMQYPYLYLSGITLSLYSLNTLEQLWAFLDRYRSNNGKVVFDINYRKASWKNRDHAVAVFTSMLHRTDIALPSFDDEKELYGEHTYEQCLARYISAGATEIVIKDGINGCLLFADQETTSIPVPVKVKPIDTTAAGDSFNGAYLAARLKNISPKNAVIAGQACAALVIQHRGAIVPKELFTL
jgi:2-dehydro-3-deoxygluconokinase